MIHLQPVEEEEEESALPYEPLSAIIIWDVCCCICARVFVRMLPPINEQAPLIAATVTRAYMCKVDAGLRCKVPCGANNIKTVHL